VTALWGAHTLVVIRPYLDSRARKLLEACRRRGVRLVADFDDLLFAGDPRDHPLVQSGALGETACAAAMAHYRDGLALFDAFTVATAPLRDELSPLVRGPVHWLPNGLSRSWLAQGRALYRSWQPGDRKVIRYLAGSPSHDADFAVIVALLAELLRARRDLSLEIVGPLRLPSAALPEQQVLRRPAVPHAELARLLASSWVTLAPLVSTRFTRCKSSIKFLESAAFGAPCIATPIADMERHADGGVLLASDEGQWYAALTALLDDELRMEIAGKVRRYADRHGMVEAAPFGRLQRGDRP
jgi:glycosyltransferase involved in cell wall biosynthesis